MKKKKNYEQPETAVTRVELESPICTGSVNMTAQSPTEVTSAEAQTVNQTFASENDFTGVDNNHWD